MPKKRLTPLPLERFTDADIEAVAQLCHEAKRLLQRLWKESVDPTWEETSDLQRASVVQQVRIQLERDEKGLPKEVGTPHHVHNRWMGQKATDGWRLGPKEDAVRREHPGMIPWTHLAPVHRRKDHLRFGIVQAMLAMLDEEV